MKKVLICTAVAIGLGACATKEKMETDTTKKGGSVTANADHSAAITATKLTSNLDKGQVPGTDFFQYATGGWQNANPITDEYARYGQFDALREKNREQLKDLVLEQAAKKGETGSNSQKVGDLYNLVMDSTRRNNEGVAPVKP